MSITPACAAEISQEKNNTKDMQTNVDTLTKSIDNDTAEIETEYNDLKIHTDNINTCLNYIIGNWYKFWKWGTINKKFTEIKAESKLVQPISDKLKDSAEKISINAQKLQNLQQQYNNTNNDTLVDENAWANADNMIKNIEEDTKISLSINNVQNLTKGDIVQYKSQNKYYRYLQYIKTEKNGNVVLKGNQNKVIVISLKDLKTIKYKLTSKNPINSSAIVNKAYNIQKSELDYNIKTTKESRNTYKGIAIKGSVIGGLGLGLLITGVSLFYIGMALMPFVSVFGAFLIAVGLILVPPGLIMAPIGVVLAGIGAVGLLINAISLKGLSADLNDLLNYDDGSNHYPVAENMNLTSNTTTIKSTFNASDIDEDHLNFTVLNQPLHGTLKVEKDGNFTYTANNDSNGTDSFTYIANDGNLNSNNATVTLNTNVPTANNMNLTTVMNRAINTTFNVTNPKNNTLIYTVLSEPMHGTLNCTDDGKLIYTPNINYTGTDNFTYKVNNGFFESNIAVVNITINPNKPPVTFNMTLLTNKNKSINELFNITDPDPDLLSIIITKKPQHGTITINTNGRFTYTPNSNYIGKDYFCYTGNDGLLNSNTATITINIQN